MHTRYQYRIAWYALVPRWPRSLRSPPAVLLRPNRHGNSHFPTRSKYGRKGLTERTQMVTHHLRPFRLTFVSLFILRRAQFMHRAIGPKGGANMRKLLWVGALLATAGCASTRGVEVGSEPS